MTVIDFTEEDVAALMGLLLENQSKVTSSQPSDPIVESNLGVYYTFGGLREDFSRIMTEKGGRYSLLGGSKILGVTVECLQSAMQQQSERLTNSESNGSTMVPILSSKLNQQGEVVQVVTEYVSNGYLDSATDYLAKSLEREGTMLLSEAFRSLHSNDSNSHVSVTSSSEDDSFWLRLLEDRMKDHDIIVKTKENGSRVLTTKSFWISFVSRVFEKINNLQSQKTHLSSLCQDQDWDLTWVLEALENPPDGMTPPAGELQGQLIFLPKAFKESQFKAVMESFHFHGFVIVNELASRLDLSSAQVIRHIQQQEDNVWVLANKSLVVSQERLVMPWISLVQEANASSSWCDFSIPLELFRCERAGFSIERELLDRVVRESDNNDVIGVACVSKDTGTALYFSPSMIESLVKGHIPHLISEYCKCHAISILEQNNGESIPVAELMDEDSPSRVVPPPHEFVKMFLLQYPALSDNYGKNKNNADTSVLLALCDRAFIKRPSVQKMATTVMHNEMERVRKQAKSIVIHSSGATENEQDFADHEEIIVPFEDPECFAAACFRVQALFKFYEYAVKREMEALDRLADEILSVVCFDFTRRIHQYALTKREDLPAFTFSFQDPEDSSFRPPTYCSVVDTTAADLGRRVRVVSSPDPGTGKPRDPLELILEMFPGDVGKAISEQYKICQSIVEDQTMSREIQLRSYLELVEKNTLTTCGLPFKKLDKKSEKSFLQNRKLKLRSKLEEAKDPKLVLDLTIMILYQSIRNIYVAGSFLSGPVLTMLLTERKIPEKVGKVLNELVSQVSAGKEIDQALVESVRGCGLCKDISKHTPM